MYSVVALAVGLVAALAAMERGREDTLGWWRVAAGATGALYPYVMDMLLWLLGSGAYLQMQHGFFWALPLAPFHAIAVAAGLRAASGKLFGELFVPVAAGMASTIMLALLTSDGIAPLALLWDGRVGLNVLYDFDALVFGLSALTLVLAGVFYPLRMYVARMGLVCLVLYVLSTAGFAWQARGFGGDYAEEHGLEDSDVVAVPQALSPMNWRVMVTDNQGFVHDTLINLKRDKVLTVKEGDTRAARIDALYRPRRLAVWRVYDRFGRAGEDTAEDRLRVERAWDAWQDTSFAWYGRYAVFDGLVQEPLRGLKATCVQFVDLRYEAARDEEHGVYVVCPKAKGGARVLRPDDGDYEELVGLGVM
ncbi:MAG: hypothetical protein H6922_01980 [Pseudomonadaceae bacterium]|nr:hypothetical protein [Pseudomonadaceae bacterium]